MKGSSIITDCLYKVPLMSVIGASNEYPDEGKGLEALFDRFLCAVFEIDYIADEDEFCFNDERGWTTSANAINDNGRIAYNFNFSRHMVAIPDEVYETLSKIRMELRDEGIRPSDRRFKQSNEVVLQAKALINQRQVVKVDDIVILENALWETVDQKDTVSLIVRSHAQDVVTRAIDSIQNEANEVFNSMLKDNSTDAGMEATQKMKALVADLNKLKKHNQSRSMDIDPILDKVKSMQQEILDSILEPMDFENPNDKVGIPF